MRAWISIIILANAAVAYGQATPYLPQGPYFPYTNKDRSLDYARHYPVWRTGNVPMGSHQVFPPSGYNPVHPNADFDGDGIINRLDPDMDGDGILDYNDQIGGGGGDVAGWWTPPSENPSWSGPIPWWDAELKRVLQPPSGWWNDAPGVAVWNLHHDLDGDGTLNGYDTDDDGDGLLDVMDFDHPLAHPAGSQYIYHDFDGDGIPNGEDEDADGDGWGDKLTSHLGADPSPRIYQPHPNATLDDWDGDGYPNNCDPEPLYRNVPGFVPTDWPYEDWDGDGWPNGCDPEPCNPDLPGPMDPKADEDGDGIPNGCDPHPCDPDGLVLNPDLDGDGYPNSCDPDPCDPAIPANPPADPANPCDGIDPGGPDNPGGPSSPSLPDRPPPPPPNPRPDPSPDKDIPPDNPPPHQPPSPPPPPSIDPPSDDECCAAICARLDSLIVIGNQTNVMFTATLNAIERFVGNGDGHGGIFGHFVQRLLTDDDSLRQRMDSGLWTLADKLDLIKYEIEWTNKLLTGDGDPGDLGPIEVPDGLGTHKEYLDGVKATTESAMSDRYPGWSWWPDLSGRSDSAEPPVWQFSFDAPVIDSSPFDVPSVSFEVDFAAYAPIRPMVHGAIILLCVVQSCMLIWEELRRY